MTPKLIGCCSSDGCDKEVFEIVRRDSTASQPLKVGPATEDAVRATFLLVDGSKMDLTFCRECADKLEPTVFPMLWQRCMLSWIKQSGVKHTWVAEQRKNGIMGLLRTQPWGHV